MAFIRFINSLFCKHKSITFIGNIHGDLINAISGHNKVCRSAYICVNCGKTVFKETLNWEALMDHRPTYNEYINHVGG